MSAQTAAWNRGDIDGFMNGYARSDATEFIAGDKLTRGWQTVRDRYKKKYDNREKMGMLTFSELKITLLGDDAALVLGRWKLVRNSDKPHGRFTLLFRRTPDGWRIVHDHTSAAEPAKVRSFQRLHCYEGRPKMLSSVLARPRCNFRNHVTLLTFHGCQRGEQLPVNPVKATIAKNRDNILGV